MYFDVQIISSLASGSPFNVAPSIFWHTPVNADSFFAFPYERMYQVYIVNSLHQT